MLAVSLLTGCSILRPQAHTPTPGAHTPVPTATPSAAASSDPASFAHQYLATIAPYTRAFETFEAGLGGGSISTSELTAIAAPLTTTLQQLQAALHRLPWPPQRRLLADAHTLAAAAQAELADLQLAPNATSVHTWAAQFNADASRFGAADHAVRADLALP